ncbi:MAG: UDP-N-acetyl glucosamine 2-epimerase [Candidatus Altiarchaeota archaeon]|nr:UDP-N-acetyl glucosamine 2-epimerase [Candidatus Altiarchaeota archaeon]
MTKIAFSIGTRAELIKIFPVLKGLDEYTLIHTGQHSLGPLLDLFDLKEPDMVLSSPPKGSTKFFFNTPKALAWSIGMAGRIRKAVKKSKADVLVYHGDTMTTAASAIASKFSKVNGVHLEAGLRSGSLWEPWPEELSRKIADRYSKTLLAVSEGTKENLLKAKVKGTILNTGNTIVDAAIEAKEIGKGLVDIPETEYAVVTAHRQENLRSRERMTNLVNIVKNVPIDTYFFAHDNTIAALKKFHLYKPLVKHVKFARLGNYVTFTHWLANSKLILTDGGSIQEESLVFKKPCILLRKKTERIEGLATGINFLTGMNVPFAIRKIDEVLNEDYKVPKFKNPYGERGVSKKVVEELQKSE